MGPDKTSLEKNALSGLDLSEGRYLNLGEKGKYYEFNFCALDKLVQSMHTQSCSS